MVPVKNNIGVLVVNVPATVESLNEKVIKLKNEKETPYRIGGVKIKYPDGEEDVVDARFYVKSINAHPEVFKVGSKINLEIQAEGEYAGRAVAKLGGNIANVEKLLGKKVLEDESMTQAMQESIVSDNVIEQELVV